MAGTCQECTFSFLPVKVLNHITPSELDQMIQPNTDG